METRMKPRWLLVVQCDSISGENAGFALHALYEAGAMNVQILNTIAKKNRPGFLFLIDADEETLNAVEACILREIGVTGWHRLPSEHRYVAVDVVKKNAVIAVGEARFEFVIERKRSSADPTHIRPEYDCCVRLQTELGQKGRLVSLPLIRQKIAQAFADGTEPVLIQF